MIWTLIFVATLAMVSSDSFYTPSSDVYLFGLPKLLLPLLNDVDVFDIPYSVSNARTTPARTMEPTVDQLMYYNYYTASMYCPYELKKLSCEYCQKFKNDVANHTVFENDVHDTLALITLSHKRSEIVVAYRGSMNAWNFVLDVLMINDGRSNVKIHAGFLLATKSLYYRVVAKVKAFLKYYATYKIVFCGHSLGAAMARITQYLSHSTNQFPRNKMEVYTYGEPRSGNKAYVDYLNKLTDKTARVVARADIIPHYPPTSILGLTLLWDYYIHVQTEFWIDGKDGQRFCDRTKYEDRNCSMSLGPLYSLVDHLTYFDADYFKCFLGNPVALTSLPLDLPQLPSIIPALPKPISDLLAELTHLGVSMASPILGR